VSSFIAAAFARNGAEIARQQWRRVADQAGPKPPKLATLTNQAGTDVLAYTKAIIWLRRSCLRMTNSPASSTP
jgi:hypothetical protein